MTGLGHRRVAQASINFGRFYPGACVPAFTLSLASRAWQPERLQFNSRGRRVRDEPAKQVKA
jgi:hypothetical protein